MTYREKLQKEHPEKINEFCFGCCQGCPKTYGYGPEHYEDKNYCKEGPSRSRCEKCWTTVIPDTEDKKYENLTRDELIEIINHLEHTIELEDKEIQHRGKLVNERDQKIKDLEDRLVIKDSIILNRDREIEELHNNLHMEVTENGVAAEKIKRLEQKLEYRRRDIAVRDEAIVNLELKLRKPESTFGPISPCDGAGKCCGCDKKDKEIERLKQGLEFELGQKDYWYNECHRLSKKVCDFEESNQELKDALAKEKSEHAKHHGINTLFRIFD